MGKKSGSSTKQVSTLTGGQRDLLDQLTDLLGGQLGQGIQPYQGQVTANMSPLTQSGINYFGDLLPTAQAGSNVFANVLGQYNPTQGFDYLSQGADAMGSMLADFDPTSARNYWNEAVKMPAMQTWQNDIVPQIMEKYAGQNATDSGAMRRAIANSGANMNTGLNAQLANLLFSGEQAQLGRQQQGVNQAMQMSQMPGQLAAQAGGIGSMGMDMVSQMMNAGGMEGSYNQQQLTDQYNKWATEQGYNNPWLQYLGTALGTHAFQPVVTQKSGWMDSLMPALGAFAGSDVGAGMIGKGIGALGGMASGAASGIGGMGAALLGML